MITMTELKQACNGVIEEAFPQIKIYGNDTMDGYARPAFFTEIIPHGFSHDTKNYSANGATFKATLLEQTHDEALCLNVYDKIQDYFGMTLPVGARKLLVGEISFDFIGEYRNILQISVEFDWYEQKAHVETEPLAEAVGVSVEKKGE